jgi:hypothetical protein
MTGYAVPVDFYAEILDIFTSRSVRITAEIPPRGLNLLSGIQTGRIV